MQDAEKSTTSEADRDATKSGAHEIGHAGGLRHKDDPSNPEKIKKSMKASNIMQQGSLGDKKPTISPQQLSEISRNIKNKTTEKNN
jgi:hypothetical protein